MSANYFNNLNRIVELLLKDEIVLNNIENLKTEIQRSKEPFLWEVINLDVYKQDLPPIIESGWIFVLKKNTPSVAHYHPNSIQHTVMIEGKGKVNVSDQLRDLKSFNPSNEDIWIVIDKDVPHEFFPYDQDMVVVSFHTCIPEDLVEIKCEGHEHRIYEK
ncbi:MAG: hypothetical protein JSW00_02440 [Thermoplasmata archaeon]|nr:MAG: hypothetical protein JSW00_02440 [Thermoplasmata archaeon]